MPDEVITLVSSGDGIYTEPGWTMAWVRDSYTEPRESLLECCVCDKEIEDWHFWTCMDGGEAAHQGCVNVRMP